MRLSLVCFFKKTVPGHIFRGKRRLVPEVTKKSMNSLLEDYELQERNMLLLRHPYLTMEESSGHSKALGKQEAKFKMWNETQVKASMKPHVTIEERLIVLRCNERWE